MLSDQLAYPNTPQQGSDTRKHRDFLGIFFELLDQHGVRYCLLEAWDELPEQLGSDVDIAVHDQDRKKLAVIFEHLRREGYLPAQAVRYFVGAYSFRFFWMSGATLQSVAVDVIFKYPRGMSFAIPVQKLISSRRRRGLFWIPSTSDEFLYLLSRRVIKGSATQAHLERLDSLTQQLGNTEATRLVKSLFVFVDSATVVSSCRNLGLQNRLRDLQWKLLASSFLRHPLRFIAYRTLELLRLLGKVLRPPGLLVAVMGPDGSGKSTLIRNLIDTLGSGFNGDKRFHWRPMLLARNKQAGDTSLPHAATPHSYTWSIMRLFSHVLDFWLGYWVLILPFLARSGLVVFDRYFDDIRIDPKRYRFRGPLWLARAASPLVAAPDIILVLNAPEAEIFSRKQELPPEELRRQTKLFAAYQANTPRSVLLDAGVSAIEVSAAAMTTILDHLAKRSLQRYPDLLGVNASVRETMVVNRAGQL